MRFIPLQTYRRKGINAYLAPALPSGKPDTSKAIYGDPEHSDRVKAYQGKRCTIKICVDNLPDGKYIYKEAGGADFTKSIYGWIQLVGGEIVNEG